jgi:hypothetical protein
LYDLFNIRVIGDVAHDLRAMLGERLLKFIGRVKLEIGDREIRRLVATGSDTPLSNSQLTNPAGFSRETTSL